MNLRRPLRTLVRGIAIAAALLVSSPLTAAPPTIEATATTTDWPRPCLLVPELSAAPVIDGARDAGLWDNAATGALTYPLGSSQAVPADTRFRAGHYGGRLYLLITYDWPGQPAPVSRATERDGPIWQDDGAELYFAPVDDLNHPRQLSFNLAGVRGDQVGTRADAYTAHIKYEAAWNPHWQVAGQRQGDAWVAELAIPLREMTGLTGRPGEVFRFNLVRNRVDQPPPILHWSPVEGRLNCRPEYFGFAVLTGPEPETLGWDAIPAGLRPSLFFVDPHQCREALTGQPWSVCLFNPVGAALKKTRVTPWQVALRDAAGKAVAADQITATSWPQQLRIEPGDLAAGSYRFELADASSGPPVLATSVTWGPTVRVEAEDRFSGAAQGKTYVGGYPRSVGQTALFLNGVGTSVSVTNYGTAAYLCLPPAFTSPGMHYGSTGPVKLQCRVDNRPPQQISCLTARRMIPLAEDLAPGPHGITVELREGRWAPIDAFVFATEALAGVVGTITAERYSELLTDVQIEILRGNDVVRTEYGRNPVNGTFVMLGLAPGTYRVRISAPAWQTYESGEFKIDRAGQKVDLGVISLAFDPELDAWMGDQTIGYARTANTVPGGTFVARLRNEPPVQSAQLVSRLKTIDLAVTRTDPVAVKSAADMARVTFRVPANAPHDLYGLRLQYGNWTTTLPQAVCVREPLPARYHVAAVGHMNTWGQQTSDYLARVAATAQLGGARLVMIGNEVNAAYVAGALKDLRIPYLITDGNHTMAHWDDFFGPASIAYDDGPLRVVTFNGSPYRSWAEAGRLIRERRSATCRVLLAFEAFPPMNLVRQGQVNLLFDGHSGDAHRQRPGLPPGTLHLGLADDQQEIRWIPLTHRGLPRDARASADIPAFPVPRGGPAPLRVAWTGPNDGTAAELTAKIINKTDLEFPGARVRFELRAGTYAVTGGKILQQFTSDDGKTTVVDAEVAVAPGAEVSIRARGK
ncbi:hypothetical protein HQ590_01535 [bacterium]|nr:hypothetical protein [bacterium]